MIFRHPARLDPGTGKLGRRVRRGLGTPDETLVADLIGQLNEILRTPELWEPTARVSAEGRFDRRVVEIFYDGLEAARVDFGGLRDELLPMPTADDGYRRVLLLGTTGAGKTTVVRQILGTSPETERFPSTSTAKTTVADTELISTSDPVFRAAVTFTPRDEVIDYLTENVSEAALGVFNGRDDADVTRRLLDHINQRFRFSYVLGRSAAADADDIAEEEADAADNIDPDDYGLVDLDATVLVVRHAVLSIRAIVDHHADAIRDEFQASQDDERVVADYIEENLDTELRQSEEFHNIVDSLIDEIEKRFVTLNVGDLRRNRQGWPVSWSWETEDRAGFIKVVTRFSSNYAPSSGAF